MQREREDEQVASALTLPRLLALVSAVLAPITMSGSLGAAQTSNEAPAGPSFRCPETVGSVEAIVCHSPDLEASDRLMATLYDQARTSAFRRGTSSETSIQRASLQDMRDCAAPSAQQTQEQCLRAYYDERNNALAVAVLMRAPAMALPVIRRTDPAYAPIAEAIQLWASEPRDADWAAPERAAKRQRIVALLSPSMNKLLLSVDQSFGREILADPTGDGVTVKRIDDIFVAENRFAAFLGVLGPYLPENEPPALTAGRRAIPCAAILRHPALLTATGAVFGSTMDALVLGSDCSDMLPPTPALARLDAKLQKSWPRCEGTIRFAAFRAYQAGLDAARLGQAPTRSAKSLPRRRGVTAADLAAARTELIDYYTAGLGVSKATSTIMADNAISNVMDLAHGCGA